jgi:type I restriction enzyme S subunit
MELKPGLKQTEVRVIPDKWEVRRLAQLTSEIGDGIHSTPEYVESSAFHFINGNNLVDGRIQIAESTMCVSEVEWLKLRKELQGQTILMSINGTIGNLAFYRGEKVVLGKSAAYLNIAPGINKEYVFYSLSAASTAKYFENELTGTTIRNLSLASLRNTPIPIPRDAGEQSAIAGALEDVGVLIGALGQLIAKKQDLKRAAMQQLLTGRRRLPGFSRDWKPKRLRDIAPLQRGFDLPTSQIRPGPYPVIYSNGLLNYHARFMVTGPGVVTGRSGTIGKVHYVNQDFWPHNTSLWVTSFKGNDPKFIFFLYSYLGFERFAAGSGVPTLNRNDAHSFYVDFPDDRDEQIAIAAVLSDMDTDIAVLEQRRDKTRAIKQGMMQELLTGKTRLI